MRVGKVGYARNTRKLLKCIPESVSLVKRQQVRVIDWN
jgi:hypothetical protein